MHRGGKSYLVGPHKSSPPPLGLSPSYIIVCYDLAGNAIGLEPVFPQDLAQLFPCRSLLTWECSGVERQSIYKDQYEVIAGLGWHFNEINVQHWVSSK